MLLHVLFKAYCCASRGQNPITEWRLNANGDKLNFKLHVSSSVSMRGTHDSAIDLNSVLGCSIKPIFTGSDAIGDLRTSDLVAIGCRQWREREKTTLSFLLEIPKDSLNVNEKGRPKVPPPSVLGSMPSLCMNEQWPSLTPSACQSLRWRPGLVSRIQETGKMAPAVCRRSQWSHKRWSCKGLRWIRHHGVCQWIRILA